MQECRFCTLLIKRLAFETFFYHSKCTTRADQACLWKGVSLKLENNMGDLNLSNNLPVKSLGDEQLRHGTGTMSELIVVSKTKINSDGISKLSTYSPLRGRFVSYCIVDRSHKVK